MQRFTDDLHSTPADTVRIDSGGNSPLYLDRYGRPTTTPPTAVPPPEPEKPNIRNAPKPYDPYAKYPDTGESRAPFRVVGGKVINMTTGKVVEREEDPMSGFSILVRGMTSQKIGGGV